MSQPPEQKEVRDGANSNRTNQSQSKSQSQSTGHNPPRAEGFTSPPPLTYEVNVLMEFV